MAYWYSNYQSSFLWLDFSRRTFLILESALFGISLLPLSEDSSLPVVWTVMFVLWHVFVNSEDLIRAPYSSTCIKANLLSWFLNVLQRNFRMSRGGCLLMDVNSKGCEVEEHISTKFEVNTQMFSTLNTQNPSESWTQGQISRHQWLYLSGLSCLDQDTNREGIFQVREIFWETFHDSFSCHSF